MTAPTIDGQLICASKMAYAIEVTGPVPGSPPYDVGAGLRGTAQGFATGSSRVDAALVGTGDLGVVLAFRGTLPPNSPDREQTLKDWLFDLEVALVLGDKLPGRVHHGFLNALDALWPDVWGEVTKQLAASNTKHLFVTGHSKGGAVAHLAAARLAASNVVHGSDITVRTFEGAHPGNQAFADAYARLVDDVIRYEFEDDLVPHVPPSFMFRQLFKNEPFFDPLMAIDNGVDYAPAGKLQFIDWNGEIQDSSTLLSTERFAHLAKRIAMHQFVEIAESHSIDCGSGCMKALCPVGVCP